MLNEAKSLSNNNSWAKEGQRKAPKSVTHVEYTPYSTLREEP